jgi:hypothetical protein
MDIAALADLLHETSEHHGFSRPWRRPTTGGISQHRRRLLPLLLAQPVARTYCALPSSSTYLGRRVSKSMILAQVGVIRMRTICL